MNRSESIQKQFGASASRYSTSTYHRNSPDLEAMIEAVPLAGRERVLDLGTGTGHTAAAYAPHVAEVVALDLTAEMLAEARALGRQRKLTNLRFQLGDAMDLPFPDGSFDLVTCRVCAHHFAAANKAMTEAARVLRSGGRLVLVDTIAPADPAADTFLNCIELLRDPSHVRNYSVAQWCEMLTEAQLEPSCAGSWGAPLDFDEWVERMQTPELARRQLRALLDDATDAIRKTLAIRSPAHSASGGSYGFDIPVGLFIGKR